MIENRAADVDVATDVIDEFLQIIHKDRILGMLAMELQAVDDEYLFRHGVDVAVLSMIVSEQMGFPKDQVLELGIGAMFHDLGMLKVPRSIWMAPRELTAGERSQIECHPIYTVNTLGRFESVSGTSLLVAYQIHERCDGSGYPRGRHEMYIHPLARIASVVDTYVASTSWRPHRGANSPYESMVRILVDIRQGQFDRSVIRALLDCTSLFPVGSYVRLSDNRKARVLRSNGGQHTRPVVVPLRPDGSESDEAVDLIKSDHIRVEENLNDPWDAGVRPEELIVARNRSDGDDQAAA